MVAGLQDRLRILRLGESDCSRRRRSSGRARQVGTPRPRPWRGPAACTAGFFGVSQSNLQRRNACRRTGSRNPASAQVWPPSVLTAISVTSVSRAAQAFHPSKPSGHNPMSSSNRETAHLGPGYASALTEPTTAAPTRPECPVPPHPAAVDGRCPCSPVARTAARHPRSADPRRPSPLPARG